MGRKKRGEKPRRTCFYLAGRAIDEVPSSNKEKVFTKKIARQKSEQVRSRLAGLKKTSEERANEGEFDFVRDASRRALRGSSASSG